MWVGHPRLQGAAPTSDIGRKSTSAHRAMVFYRSSIHRGAVTEKAHKNRRTPVVEDKNTDEDEFTDDSEE